MPDYLSYEQLKGLEKGKGIKLPDCADFLGEHWCAAARFSPGAQSGAMFMTPCFKSGLIQCAASTCVSG